MSDTKTIFWLQRVLEEKCSDIKKTIERISILNYQIHNFPSMQPEIKKEVIDALKKDLERYGWDNATWDLKI